MARVTVRLFASAREAAGRAGDSFDADDLDELLAAARARFGPTFTAVLATARVWVNGDEPPNGAARLADGDEIAVLPPVSGG
jgi:molybdopterin synthase sulfur carrier subunit